MVFEQYHRHTAWDRPGGLANRSGAGDLDVVVYSARKWARLALAGNRRCCCCSSSPTRRSCTATSAGVELVQHADRFVSRIAGDDFLGYLREQRAALTGEVGAITLPVPEPHRSRLRAVRRGEVPLREVLDEVSSLEHEMTQLRSGSYVPPEPDRTWVDGWLHRSSLATWASCEEGVRPPG